MITTGMIVIKRTKKSAATAAPSKNLWNSLHASISSPVRLLVCTCFEAPYMKSLKQSSQLKDCFHEAVPQSQSMIMKYTVDFISISDRNQAPPVAFVSHQMYYRDRMFRYCRIVKYQYSNGESNCLQEHLYHKELMRGWT